MNAFEKRVQNYIKVEEKHLIRLSKHCKSGSFSALSTFCKTKPSYCKLFDYNSLVFIEYNIKQIKNYRLIKKLFALNTKFPFRFGTEFKYKVYDTYLFNISMKLYNCCPIVYLQWYHSHISNKTTRFICKYRLSTYVELYKFINNSLKLKTLKEKQNMIDSTAKLLFDANLIDENLKDLCYNVKDDEQFERYIGKFIDSLVLTKNIKKICNHLKERYSKILISDDIVLKLGNPVSHGTVQLKSKKTEKNIEWYCEYTE